VADADLLTEISREAELLLCCARTSLEGEHADRMRRLLEAGIDWEALLGAALRHGVMPLLYWNLNATCPEAVPGAVLERLRDLFHANLRRNLFLTGELFRVLDLLEGHGIRAIPYKGPALAAAVYGNLAFRQFGDLDILVRKGDVLRARDLLGSLGYRAGLQLDAAQAQAFLASHCELELVRDDGRIMVELHWEILPRYFALPPAIGHLSEELRGGGTGASGLPSLPPEETLLFLSIHGAKHLWERLGWVSDVAELIRVHRGLGWQRVLGRARALRAERMLLLGLFLARDLLDAVVPEDVGRRFDADSTVRRLARDVRTRLFDGNGAPAGLWESCLFHLRARERLEDRVRYCVSRALTTTHGDWAVLPLPPALFPIYALLRPLRLAQKYGLGLLRRRESREVSG
jgi:hypothetical protein